MYSGAFSPYKVQSANFMQLKVAVDLTLLLYFEWSNQVGINWFKTKLPYVSV
jgi:hypothetical protein